MVEVTAAQVDLGLGLLSQLRAATARDHEALETALDMLGKPISQARMTQILSKFYGFHMVWESAIGCGPFAAFASRRSRMAHLRSDLLSLGNSPADLGAIQGCDPAAKLAASRASALGSLYVMEGSTLGGRVISKALRSANWARPEYLTYFNPYGDQTATRWRDFQSWLIQEAASEDPVAIVEGACLTFQMLAAWLPPAAPS